MYYLKIGSLLRAKVHVLSDSVFCTGPGALDRLADAVAANTERRWTVH